MSRAALIDALCADALLNGVGLNEDTIFHNWSSDERPSNATPFIIMNWGSMEPPHWQSVKPFEPVTIWVHWPAELTKDFTKINSVLDMIDDTVKELRDLSGSDGYTLSFVQIGGRSGDLIDDGFNTITKNANYEVFSRRSV